MGLADFVSGARNYYDIKVKPALDEKNYEVAKLEAANLAISIGERFDEIAEYRGGQALISSSKIVLRQFRKEIAFNPSSYPTFRERLGQIETAIQSGDRL